MCLTPLMSRRLRFPAGVLFAVVAAAAVLTAVAAPRADDPPCDFDKVERIVAVGDVHGAYERYVEILRTAGVLDQRDRWIGGKTHLVQLGDVVDRGPDSRKAIDLLRKLERDAASAGGKVHYLLGNHEVMRIIGDYRYLVPGEDAAFADGSSRELREQLAETVKPEQRDEVLKLPLGHIELIRAFGPKGPYGTYLRALNTVVSPAAAPMPCASINETVRREITTDVEKTRAEPTAFLTTREDGPLWYRGLAQEPETFAPEVDKILAGQQARAIVVAHTVTPTGRVDVRFNGKVFVMDTGMQPAYVAKGRASALEIRGNVFTAIYTDRRDVRAGAALATASR
jgi:calcineurin-like phosphoesterase family protein